MHKAIDKLVEAFFWIDHHMKAKGWKVEKTAQPVPNPFEGAANGAGGKKRGRGRSASAEA